MPLFPYPAQFLSLNSTGSMQSSLLPHPSTSQRRSKVVVSVPIHTSMFQGIVITK